MSVNGARLGDINMHYTSSSSMPARRPMRRGDRETKAARRRVDEDDREGETVKRLSPPVSKGGRTWR